MAIQKRANGGLRKNAGDLTPELAKRIVAAVKRTPLSLNAAAKAVAIHPSELRYIVKRGSLPGADPLWVDTSVHIRELIAAAEARNFRRLEKAATGGTVVERVLRPDPDVPGAEPRLVEVKEKVIPANVSAQSEIQRMIEADVWKVDPGAEDAPIVYMDLFSRPNELPPEILEALVANGWSHAALSVQRLDLAPAGGDQPALADASEPDPA